MRSSSQQHCSNDRQRQFNATTQRNINSPVKGRSSSPHTSSNTTSNLSPQLQHHQHHHHHTSSTSSSGSNLSPPPLTRPNTIDVGHTTPSSNRKLDHLPPHSRQGLVPHPATPVPPPDTGIGRNTQDNRVEYLI